MTLLFPIYSHSFLPLPPLTTSCFPLQTWKVPGSVSTAFSLTRRLSYHAWVFSCLTSISGNICLWVPAEGPEVKQTLLSCAEEGGSGSLSKITTVCDIRCICPCKPLEASLLPHLCLEDMFASYSKLKVLCSPGRRKSCWEQRTEEMAQEGQGMHLVFLEILSFWPSTTINHQHMVNLIPVNGLILLTAIFPECLMSDVFAWESAQWLHTSQNIFLFLILV